MLINQKLERLIKRFEGILNEWSTLPALKKEILQERGKAVETMQQVLRNYDHMNTRPHEVYKTIGASSLAILKLLEDINYSEVSQFLKSRYFPTTRKPATKKLAKRGA